MFNYASKPLPLLTSLNIVTKRNCDCIRAIPAIQDILNSAAYRNWYACCNKKLKLLKKKKLRIFFLPIPVNAGLCFTNISLI